MASRCCSRCTPTIDWRAFRAKPVVDELERDVGDRAIILRVDLLEDVGEALGDLDVHASPTFLVFDARGRLVQYS